METRGFPFSFDIPQKGFKMKKINTESAGYKFVRGAFGYAAFVGGAALCDIVAMPFIYADWTKHKGIRVLRKMSLLGTYGLSLISGAAAQGGIEFAFDTLVEGYNNLVDFSKNAKPEKKNKKDAFYHETWEKAPTKVVAQYLGIDIPGKNASLEKECRFVDKLITETRPFEFSNELEAKKAVQALIDTAHKNGFATLAFWFDLIGREIPKNVRDILDMYGWNDESVHDIGIDCINDGSLYMVDAYNYSNLALILQKLDDSAVTTSKKED